MIAEPLNHLPVEDEFVSAWPVIAFGIEPSRSARGPWAISVPGLSTPPIVITTVRPGEDMNHRMVVVPELVLAVFVCAGSAQGQEDLAAVCRNGHLQSRAAIRSLSCRVEIHTPPGKEFNPYRGTIEEMPTRRARLEWWQDSGMIRCRYDSRGDGSHVIDVLWKDGALKTLYSQISPDAMKTKITAGKLEGEKGLETVSSPWQLALFGWPGPLPCTFDKPAYQGTAMADLKGHRCIRVTQADNVMAGEIWFDPKLNYLVRKSVQFPHPGDRSSWYEEEVASFREWKPGIFFPEVVIRRKGEGGQLSLMDRVVFQDVRINEPIDPTVFLLNFPADTTVTDVLKGVKYEVGAGEQPVSAPRPASPPQNLSGEGMPTYKMSPWYNSRWLAIAVGTVGLLGTIGVFVWRRRRTEPIH